MRPFTPQSLALFAYFALIAIALVSAESSSSLENTPSNGCPASLEPITCPEGETANYIPQNSLECAHYECMSDSSNSNDSNNSGNNSGNNNNVVLAAVLGSIIPLAAIGAGVFFFLHWRKKNKRASDAQHGDAKYMADYNSLDDNAFGGNGMHMADAYSSTYSISKWRDSALQIPETPGSHASIPIIFSAEYSMDQLNGSGSSNGGGPASAVNRETRLYNTNTSSEDTRKWAAPNVVNVKQKPQLVVLGGGAASSSSLASALEIDTSNLRSEQVHGESSSSRVADNEDSASPATPLSPETPESLASVAKISAPATIQLPRIVQIGNPQATRAVEADVGQQAQPPGSPLRSVANGWDSESEFSDSGDSDAESFSPAADASRPVSQTTARQTTKPALGADLPFENDSKDSLSKDILSATNGIRAGHESSKP
ncbi:hypothetical protein IW140_004151 [Coemansia sp. RSA 1813]|nr:hypothetical protein EV178_004147 [Coemansia sp. RSA 1646]KAJ1770937.1 hypothetical protein LPJ74_002736 [Coemansia sp. RSA 1843]KAJ2088256.1 hypothetical protein IW138_004332 [Coemansia sp. RSA 986]KAJ2213266.1 hypothetical protein EV179_003957 [Coemansia sp. RSA 487]KAJ2568153.1 hypothetical protein IW140_004151 [Coemansia sp. RSA 1813]